MQGIPETILGNAGLLEQWQGILQFKHIASSGAVAESIAQCIAQLDQVRNALLSDVEYQLQLRQVPLYNLKENLKRPTQDPYLLIRKATALLRNLPHTDITLTDMRDRLAEIETQLQDYCGNRAPYIDALVAMPKLVDAYFLFIHWGNRAE